MAWRGVHITRPARLAVADGQLAVSQDDGEARIALEDIAWVVIDTPQVSVTTSLIGACMEAGIALITTDARHTPSGLILPFHRHHRQAGIAALQAASGAPLKKRLWQRVVQAKIANQAAVLQRHGTGADALAAMAHLVGSGDPDNVEARAALHYWRRLFPAFVREDAADKRNMMLNYAYAVLRAGIARALVGAGLLPAFGIHHASVTNAFNLADDLIEPFRPFADRLVWQLADAGRTRDGEPTVADRRALAAILTEETSLGGETVTLLIACERAAAGLVAALETNSAAALRLPAIAP